MNCNGFTEKFKKKVVHRMDNMTDSLLETYLFETNSLLEQLDEILINAEKSLTFTEENVNEIFRAMHTIKGSSAMLDFPSLMEVAHHIEDLFFYIRENGMAAIGDMFKEELFNLMFASMDKLRGEVEKVENNEPLDTNISEFADGINVFLSKIKGETPADAPKKEAGGKAAAAASNSKAPQLSKANFGSEKPFVLQVFYEPDGGMEHLRSFMLVTSLKEQGLDFLYYPEEVDSNSQLGAEIAEHGFLIAFGSEEELNMAVEVLKQTSNIHSYELVNADSAGPSEEKPAEEAPAKVEPPKAEAKEPAKAPAAEASDSSGKESANGQNNSHVKQSLISVNLSKLDKLMALVGEIVITESMVIASPELQNVKLDEFLKSARQLRKLTDDLQDVTMSLRMVSVSGVFQKMNRIVRDMKKSLKKDVHLTIIGEDTEVDKTIVDSISDPIMHLVRNAMDHGIEDSAKERIAAGKSAQAEIVLSAKNTGSEVIICVEDDGRGMNPEAILAKAARSGILTKPEEEYTKKEILSLLLLPGFSTNTKVTEYSGRGVGMDVVKKNIEVIGGIISISSEVGEGSKVMLKIPLTLAIVDGMEIAVGDNIFTIPISNIRQSFKATNEDILQDASGHEIIQYMDEFFPVIRIRDLFDMPCGYTDIADGILILVEASDKSYCMFVDRLIGEQQVVVKPFPAYLNNFNIKSYGLSGCTILGNGNISIILDAYNIYNAAQGNVLN
jgi:two-component system chemotaxis sensor kinase CheA